MYIINDRIMYTGLSPLPIHLFCTVRVKAVFHMLVILISIVRLFVPFPTGVCGRLWNSIS